MYDYDDPAYDDYSDVDTTADCWAEDHGYRRLTCPRCGWSGMTDGDRPECDCYSDDTEEDQGPHCAECEETEDNCTCALGFKVETFSRVGPIRTARKAHGTNIKAGDRYRETVFGGHYRGGSRWLKSYKSKIPPQKRAYKLPA